MHTECLIDRRYMEAYPELCAQYKNGLFEMSTLIDATPDRIHQPGRSTVLLLNIMDDSHHVDSKKIAVIPTLGCFQKPTSFRICLRNACNKGVYLVIDYKPIQLIISSSLRLFSRTNSQDGGLAEPMLFSR